MNNVTKEALQKIKDEKITPKPKWQFLLRSWIMWAVFGLSLVLGSLATSVLIYLITNSDFNIHKELERSFAEHVILSIPYIWFVVMAGSLLIAVFNYQHTDKGYKHKPIIIWVASVLVSIIGGVILFFTGFGNVIDDTVSDALPGYKDFREKKAELWVQPDKGLLAGEVIEIEDDKMLILETFTDEEWEVDVSDATMMPDFEIEEGRPIAVVGEKTGDFEFEATGVKPWHPEMGKRLFGKGKYDDERKGKPPRTMRQELKP
ncbi:hypothetical protein ACFL2D_00810 [Patescibacteria group bacterium]